MNQPSISVVIPVYNAEASLRELSQRLSAMFTKEGLEAEIIFVNDGSADRSWEVIASLVASEAAVYGINLMRNYGQHNALLCGIRSARGDAIITMDDDLQNPPEEIPRLLAKLGQNYDVVYGTPINEAHGLFRNLASRITKLALQSAVGVETARQVSAFRVFRSHLRGAFADFRGPYASIDVLLTWGTRRFGAIRVRTDPRPHGDSSYTASKLIAHALNMMTGFSTLPLQIASLIGFVFTAIGIVTLLYVILRYLTTGDSVPGFPFLASIIAIFSGAQLFALGVIGEYLARIHFRMMDRPAYAVQSIAMPPNMEIR